MSCPDTYRKVRGASASSQGTKLRAQRSCIERGEYPLRVVPLFAIHRSYGFLFAIPNADGAVLEKITQHLPCVGSYHLGRWHSRARGMADFKQTTAQRMLSIDRSMHLVLAWLSNALDANDTSVHIVYEQAPAKSHVSISSHLTLRCPGAA